MTKKQKKMLTRIIICAVMLVALQFLPITGIPRFALYLAAYLVIPFGASLRYAGRPASASPAVGYMSVHQKQQQDLVNDALNVD